VRYARFLTAVGNRWNISLVPLPQSRLGLRPRAGGRAGAAAGPREVHAALAQLGYTYADETTNPAYRLFLRSAD